MKASNYEDRPHGEDRDKQSHAPKAIDRVDHLPSSVRHVAAASRIFLELPHRNPMTRYLSKKLEDPVCVELLSQSGGLMLLCPTMTPIAPNADGLA
jgi:hypothetical protein